MTGSHGAGSWVRSRPYLVHTRFAAPSTSTSSHECTRYVLCLFTQLGSVSYAYAMGGGRGGQRWQRWQNGHGGVYQGTGCAWACCIHWSCCVSLPFVDWLSPARSRGCEEDMDVFYDRKQHTSRHARISTDRRPPSIPRQATPLVGILYLFQCFRIFKSWSLYACLAPSHITQHRATNHEQTQSYTCIHALLPSRPSSTSSAYDSWPPSTSPARDDNKFDTRTTIKQKRKETGREKKRRRKKTTIQSNGHQHLSIPHRRPPTGPDHVPIGPPRNQGRASRRPGLPHVLIFRGQEAQKDARQVLQGSHGLHYLYVLFSALAALPTLPSIHRRAVMPQKGNPVANIKPLGK